MDTYGQPSEWNRSIFHSYRIGKWPNGRPFCDLPAVIGDCIIGEERTSLLIQCLESSYNALLMSAIQNARQLRGKPEKIASSLTPEENHQLLLLVRDEDLVKKIDELVANQKIRIPPTELRKIKTYAYDGSNDNLSQLSSLGIRSVGHPSIIELITTIWSTYESLSQSEDLRWRLRGHEASTIFHSITDFVRIHGPEVAIKELILPSRSITAAVAEKYIFQFFPNENEELSIKRILWKMGFNLPRYEDEYIHLRNRISEFRECILQLNIGPDESEKAKVRAVGVNLFVSVESFLENLICYNVWLLTSDHFTGTRFLYSKDDGHSAVIKTLGQEIVSGTDVFHWRDDGSNSLGCLLVYLNAFKNWLARHLNVDTQSIKRKPEDYPFYSRDTMWVFPFKHIELWADASTDVMTAYKDQFQKVCNLLGQADLPVVRNGIDHKRDDDKFPDKAKMLTCVYQLQDVLEIVDSNRLIPKLFWRTKSEFDSHGNSCSYFEDYRGSLVSLWDPSVILAGPKRKFGTPYLIAPFDFLDYPNSTLIFNVSNPSEFKQYWKDYPRRRFIPPEPNQDIEKGMDPFSGEQKYPSDEQDSA